MPDAIDELMSNGVEDNLRNSLLKGPFASCIKKVNIGVISLETATLEVNILTDCSFDNENEEFAKYLHSLQEELKYGRFEFHQYSTEGSIPWPYDS